MQFVTGIDVSLPPERQTFYETGMEQWSIIYTLLVLYYVTLTDSTGKVPQNTFFAQYFLGIIGYILLLHDRSGQGM